MPGETINMHANRIVKMLEEVNKTFDTNYDLDGAYVEMPDGHIQIKWTDLGVNSLMTLTRSDTDLLRFLIHRMDPQLGPILCFDQDILSLIRLSREGIARLGGPTNIPEGIEGPRRPGPRPRRGERI